jgi:hypothetical protein
MQLRGNVLNLTKYTGADDAARTCWPEAKMADVIKRKVYFLVWNISGAED